MGTCNPCCLQAITCMATSDEEQQRQEFWATALPRLERMGYDSRQRSRLKERLLCLIAPVPACRLLFEGDDDEVKAWLDDLLKEGEPA